MKSFFLTSIFLALFFCNAYSADEGNIYTFFVTTLDNQTETLFLNYDRNVEVNGKNYQQYIGSYHDKNYADSLVLLRREEEKYFYYDSQTSEEHLLFDFNLQKGDTFTDYFSGTMYDVIDVRDSLINDSLHRLIEIRDCESTGKHDIWIEDVGSIYTGILPKNKFKNVCLLICFRFCYSFEEDMEHSTYFFPNTPQIKTARMSVTRPQWEKELKTEEDRDEYLTWLHAPTDLNAEFKNDTLHVWGRLRTSCSIQTYAACELNGDNITFKVYPYNNLLDEDCISRYEVETHIPGFKRGTYKVSLYNKTIELECMEINDEPVTFAAGQMATIILPTSPDAGKGKYYRLDRVEGSEIIFEQELQPRARVPYIIVPGEDFSIDPSTLDLAGVGNDTVSIEGISFIGTYSRKELPEKDGFYIDIIDTTPDCSLMAEAGNGAFHVGALRAWLQVTWNDPYNQGGTKAPGEKLQIVLKDKGTSIESPREEMVNGKSSNGKCFDLSGRRLPGKPKSGLYIEGDRKTAR